MIIWIKKESIFLDCDQRAVIEKIVENPDRTPSIFVQLLESHHRFIIQKEDIVGVEINENLIVEFGHLKYKPKKKTIRKVIKGVVIQTFVDGKCVRQQFVIDDAVLDQFTSDAYKEIKDPGADLLNLYHHTNMVQP